MSSYISTELRRFVAERAAGLCEYCLIHESDTFLGCQVDHIISEKHGGATRADNLAYACTFCNRAKGTDIGSMASGSGNFVRFFNPRSDRWADHFELFGAELRAFTDIGQATVRILAFNTLDRLQERQALVLVGRYPSLQALQRTTRPYA